MFVNNKTKTLYKVWQNWQLDHRNVCGRVVVNDVTSVVVNDFTSAAVWSWTSVAETPDNVTGTFRNDFYILLYQCSLFFTCFCLFSLYIPLWFFSLFFVVNTDKDVYLIYVLKTDKHSFIL